MYMLKRSGDSVDPCNTPFLSRRKRLVCPQLVLSLKLRFDKMVMINRTRWPSGTTRSSFKASPCCYTVS